MSDKPLSAAQVRAMFEAKDIAWALADMAQQSQDDHEQDVATDAALEEIKPLTLPTTMPIMES